MQAAVPRQPGVKVIEMQRGLGLMLRGQMGQRRLFAEHGQRDGVAEKRRGPGHRIERAVRFDDGATRAIFDHDQISYGNQICLAAGGVQKRQMHLRCSAGLDANDGPVAKEGGVLRLKAVLVWDREEAGNSSALASRVVAPKDRISTPALESLDHGLTKAPSKKQM